MTVRYPAAAAAIAGAAMTESIGRYPFRSASVAAQAWLVALMLIVAAPYAAMALRMEGASLTQRAFARGISVTTAAIGVLAPAIFAVTFVSVMSLWAEHPHGIERLEHAVGTIAVAPFGFLVNHVPPLRVSPAWGIAFVLANVWLAIAVRLPRHEREGLDGAAVRTWRHNRRLGALCGVALPFVLVFGRILYQRL